jgi:hypothetical protein
MYEHLRTVNFIPAQALYLFFFASKYIQVGAINHGLLVAGLLPSLLWGCERQDEQNPLGGIPAMV